MKKVEFIFPTLNRDKELRSALASILAQTNANWKVNVVVDSPTIGIADDIVKDINDERVYITHLDKRYSDWGHTPREYGKQMCTAEYVIMGGDDSYYTPNFVEELTNYMTRGDDFIYWDMVHSHYNYQYFKCLPAYNQIDIGAFAVKTELAKQIPLGTQYAADGLYVENFKHMFPNAKMSKINKVLYVHN